MFSVEVTAPDQEGAFSAEVIFTTQFEVSRLILLHLTSLCWLIDHTVYVVCCCNCDTMAVVPS